MNQQESCILNYPFFDGEKVTENAAVILKGGVIGQIAKSSGNDHKYFLMPALMDAHTHMNTKAQVKDMLKNGIACTCDVSASASLIQCAEPFTIISSAGMTMGTLNGKAYVKKAMDAGAAYIKVLLMDPNFMMKHVLKEICDTAHRNGIKTAVHAVSLNAVRMAVECGADLLLHVPLKEEFPEKLAGTIAEKGIAVAPTLVMMEAFANGGRYGYRPEHYQNAERAVRLLHESGVKILAATDANPGSYAPAVAYGTSLHRELELLVRAGMTPTEALSAATGKIADVFGIGKIGMIKEGKRASLLLIEGRPDRDIADIKKIKRMWIDGKVYEDAGFLSDYR